MTAPTSTSNAFASAPAVYDGTPANPTETAVLEALARYKQQNCDGVLAVGGGSSLDLAKAVRVLAVHDTAVLQEGEHRNRAGG